MASEEERPGRAAVEAKLLHEAELIVTRLEAALAAAPDDGELRQQLRRMIEQARRLRQRIAEAIAAAHARHEKAE
jgi:CBS domain containing-hemolysin-like protein